MALLVFLLIAAGTWRLFAIVGSTPLLGYANQYDMGRTSACIGLWPDLPPPARFQAHPEAPLARYVRGERHPEECYLSSELLFTAPVAAVLSPGAAINLRRIGAVKAGLLIVLALALAALLRGQPSWEIMHGAVFAIVICDPMNALWLNTLYTEFAALFFLYASIVLAVAIGARETPSSPPARGVIVAFAGALCGLGLSRQQHLLLPAIIALPVVISLWRPAMRAALAILALIALTAFAQVGLMGRHPTIAAANNADVVLGAILPASLNPELTAQRLGLPVRCLQSVGANWYVTMGESLEATCPEALRVPRARQMLLLLSEPSTLARAMLRGVPQFQDWRLGYMGAVEGRDYGDAEAVRAIAGNAAFSVAPIVTGIEPGLFLTALAASLVLLAVSTPIAFGAAAGGRRAPLALCLYALTASAWYVFASAIGGDGYVEVARHAQLAAICLYAVAVTLVLSLLAPLALPFGVGARTAVLAPAAALSFALVSGGLAALLQPALHVAMPATPTAIGVIDLPRRNLVAPGPVEISGWALDPLGVTAVVVVTGAGEVIEARRDLPYAGLELYYPTYPQVARAGFSVELPARALDHGGVDIRTLVFNAAGGRTEIDRRRLVVAAR